MPTLTEFARAYSTTPNTIRSWTAEFADYLSPSANPRKGQARTYTDSDAQVIALIGEMRRRNAGYEMIHAALREGERGVWPPEGEGSPSIEDAPSAALMTKLAATVARYDGELTAVKVERDRLLIERDQEREARLAAERLAAAAEAEVKVLREMQSVRQVEQEAKGEGSTRPSWWARLRGRG